MPVTSRPPPTMRDGARIARGAVAGLAAGLVASFAMDRFQAMVTALSADEPASGAEPATEQAADRVSRLLTGGEVAAANKPLAGQAVHYTLGAALGVVYGIAAEFRPAVRAGHGSVYGLAIAAVIDEAAVPAVGLGDAPWKTGAATHFYSAVSHLVFGIVAEATRARIGDGMKPG